MPRSSSRRFIRRSASRATSGRWKTCRTSSAALNDAAVVDRLLAEVAAGGGRPTAPGIDGLVRGWVAAVAQHELARFRRAWGEFEEAKPFWA